MPPVNVTGCTNSPQAGRICLFSQPQRHPPIPYMFSCPVVYYSTQYCTVYAVVDDLSRIIRFAPLLLLLTSTGLSYDRGNKDRIYKYEFIYVKDTMVRSGPWYPLRIQFRTSKRGLYFLDRMKTLYWISRTVRYTIQVRFCYTYKWIYLRTCSTSRCLCPILYSI